MSAPPYGTRPPITDPIAPAQPAGMSVSSRLIRLDPGLFGLSLVPGPLDHGTGLPGVRVSLPPGPPGRREAASISSFRGDGWMTVSDEPTLLRVPASAAPAGAEVLVTLYWASADGAAPALRLVRLNPDGPAVPPPGGVPHGPFAPAPTPVPPVAEIVAHIEGVGDVDGKFGDWVGMRGSGRAIEGFGLTPRQGISTDDFEIRAVLGRDWLSPWVPGSNFCGSRGLALPLRGFSLRLHPGAAARYDIACFARFVDGSEVGPVSVDRICTAPSLAALEAFQVLLRPRLG